MKQLLAVVVCLFATSTTYANCRDLVSGIDERREILFCQSEHLDWAAAVQAHFLETGVNPLDSAACNERPTIEFKTYDVISRSCNGNPDTGRDLHSCGSPSDDASSYGIIITHQANMWSIHKFYREIQLAKFFYWCSTGEGISSWPWWDIPKEWA